MDGSFEEVLAQLREDVSGPVDGISMRAEDAMAVEALVETSHYDGPNQRPAVPRARQQQQHKPPPLALSLTNMAVTNDMAQVFGEALLHSQHQVSDIKLQVYWMSASRTAYASLLRYLRNSPCLTTISLYGNPTEVPGCRDTAEQILSAVAANPNVKEINLAWIELSAKSLAIQRSIKELVLIRSIIIIKDETDDEEESAVTGLQQSNLKTLIMDLWDENSSETLLAIGAVHTKVETLYVRFPLPFVQAQPIMDFVSRQSMLKEVLVRNMGNDLSHMTSLVEAMPSITTSIEVVHGYWESPTMQNICSSTDMTTCLHKTKMIYAMSRTNSMLMLHCYAAGPESKRDSMFSISEQEKIKEIGSRNYMLPVLMRSSNSFWNDADNWPPLLALGASSDHPMHFSLVYELVRDQLVQRPALRRRQQHGPSRTAHPRITADCAKDDDDDDDDDSTYTTTTSTTPAKTPYQRFLGWVVRRRSRASRSKRCS
jgi:hypothetical protein